MFNASVKILVFLLFLLSGSRQAMADTFTVTSNSDAGAGTLRQALLEAAANGSAMPDVVQFDLPQLPGQRTIVIASTLNLSSNLVIDGLTQPGTPFGVSDARVKIVADAGVFTALQGVKLNGVKIFGLFIDRQISADRSNPYSGIRFESSKNLVIGMPGKGNLVKNFDRCIQVTYGFYGGADDFNDPALLCENVKISSNMIGLTEAGDAKCELGFGNVLGSRIKELTIGGNLAAEGNKIAGSVIYNETSDVFTLKTGTLLIANNAVGLTADGKQAVETFPYTSGNGNSVNISSYRLENCEVTNNVLTGLTSGLNLNVNCFFKVRGNKFGYDAAGTTIIGNAHSAIVLVSCKGGGLIGGNGPDRNFITGSFQHKYPSSNEFGVIDNTESAGVEVIGNVFRCNQNTYAYAVKPGASSLKPVNVTITARSPAKIEGTGTAGSRVYLYYSLGCNNSSCEPEQLFASVPVDFDGYWKYESTLQNYNIIASATLAGQTSEFTSIRSDYKSADVKVTMVCGSQKGSITGVKYKNASSFTWYNDRGTVIGKTSDISGLEPGNYYLVVGDGYCTSQTETYQVTDISLKTDLASMQIKPAACGIKDGGISGIQTSGTVFTWKDKTGATVATSLNLAGIAAGTYTLTVANAALCSASYGPFVVPSAGNPEIILKDTVITPSTCSQPNGAISKVALSIAGNFTYTWKNAQQQVVGSALELSQVPAGYYTLEVTGPGICESVFSPPVQVSSKGLITLDESKVSISPAGCVGPGGSVTRLEVTGANRYDWVDETGTIVRGGIDLENAPPGKYKLVASNDFCSKESRFYTITKVQSAVFPTYRDEQIRPTCERDNGSIRMDFTSAGMQPKSIRWLNAAGSVIGTGNLVDQLPEGTYRLYLTDANGCEVLYRTFVLDRITRLTLDPQSVTIVTDHCSTGQGGATNVVVSGGLKPYNYTWTDSKGGTVSHAANLTGVKTGTYTLHVTDALGGPCNNFTYTYSIPDQMGGLPAPVVPSVPVCAPGEAVIRVKNPVQATYKLYTSPWEKVPLAESTTGTFTVTVKADTWFYISYTAGPCSSDQAAVQVLVSDDAFQVGSSFTPNGDGINDAWQITHIENYPDSDIRVFNRYGNTVYRAVGYHQPFDGKSNGTELPSGTYYYVIDLRTGCKTLTGSVTLFR